MFTTTKLFIEKNIYVLENNLEDFLELATFNTQMVCVPDLLSVLKEAGIKGISEAQEQILMNRLYIEFRRAFRSPNSPPCYDLVEWIKAHNNFNIGLSTEHILNHIMKNKEDYSALVEISKGVDNTWIITDAW